VAFGIDDIVESALGPWGLALGLGLSAVIARRNRIVPLVATGAAVGKGRIDALSSASAERARAGRARIGALNSAGAEKARGGFQKLGSVATVATGGVAAAGHLAGRARSINVARTGQALLTGVARSWSELYEEAKSEFEASRPVKSGAVWVNGERVDDLVQPAPERDARGRFTKHSES
jgi:hypothetical protein